jgi:hypothetical protein
MPPWLSLGLLGAYHGVNPAMGWLFAVALGLQERRRAAVLQALLPIALGHELAVALVVVLAGTAQLAVAPQVLRPLGACLLIGFGLYKFLRPRSHPRWVGLRVSPAELALWSFLTSTAHGAGLMLFPLLLSLPAPAPGAPGEHASAGSAGAAGGPVLAWDGLDHAGGAPLIQGIAASVVHTLAMLLAMGIVALLVYERLGVAVLRRAWVNLDAIWAGALVVAGVFTLFT